ncbi:hypothetical protein Tco_1370113 [Tanacetum coccineum]
MTKPTSKNINRTTYESDNATRKLNMETTIEIGDEFVKILQDNAFNGIDGDDVVNHIAKVLEILEWIKIPNVDKDQLRLQVCPISLSGRAKEWWDDEIKGPCCKEIDDMLLLAKKDSNGQVLIAEDYAWVEVSNSDSKVRMEANMVYMEKMKKVLSDSDYSSSSDNDTLQEVPCYSSDFEYEYEATTSDYYDKSELNYGLFVAHY